VGTPGQESGPRVRSGHFFSSKKGPSTRAGLFVDTQLLRMIPVQKSRSKHDLPQATPNALKVESTKGISFSD
jgi:hypothetical protein